MSTTSISPKAEPFVGTAELAEFLNKPRGWLYDNSKALGIPCHKIGRQYRYRISEVEAWLAAR